MVTQHDIKKLTQAGPLSSRIRLYIIASIKTKGPLTYSLFPHLMSTGRLGLTPLPPPPQCSLEILLP